MQWPHVSGGVGNTSMENPDTQDMDNISEDENIFHKLLHARQNI